MTRPALALSVIPVRDAREGGPVRHAIEARERARALRDDCLAWFPRGARHLVPALDAITKRWLARSCSPYVREIGAIAAALEFPGVWFLNGSYEWGCTSLARDHDAPWLVRTLDWPFPGLGRHIEVAHMSGPAGDFYSVTWPGFAGALTAMAPGRFAAAINQAPMWRRTRHPWLRPFDTMANAVATWPLRHMPPDHLLREVFETAADFSAARSRLETTPIARPAIYTLAGCEPGKRCVIERAIDGFRTRFEDTGAEARIGGDIWFTCSYREAGDNSRVRREALTAWTEPFSNTFDWVAPPVLNPFTRIATEMCPAEGILRVVGYEKVAGFDLPQPVTLPCEILDGRTRQHRDAALEHDVAHP